MQSCGRFSGCCGAVTSPSWRVCAFMKRGPLTLQRENNSRNRGFLQTNKAKIVKSTQKMMVTFLGVGGELHVLWIIHIHDLEKGQTINADYSASLWFRLGQEIKKNRPHLAKKKVLSHQDNAGVPLRWRQFSDWSVNCCRIHHIRKILSPPPPSTLETLHFELHEKV